MFSVFVLMSVLPRCMRCMRPCVCMYVCACTRVCARVLYYVLLFVPYAYWVKHLLIFTHSRCVDKLKYVDVHIVFWLQKLVSRPSIDRTGRKISLFFLSRSHDQGTVRYTHRVFYIHKRHSCRSTNQRQVCPLLLLWQVDHYGKKT